MSLSRGRAGALPDWVGGEPKKEVMKTFSSPLSALAWFVKETHRFDGLRVQGYEPRASGPVGRPLTIAEDRLLLLSVIGCCLRRTPRRLRRVLLLSVGDGMGSVDIGAHLGCSDRWARALLREGQAALGERLRKIGVVH